LLAGYDAWKDDHAGASKKFVEAGGLLPYEAVKKSMVAGCCFVEPRLV
jgi:hypothetical protein